MSWVTTRPWLVLCLIFVAGIVTGAALHASLRGMMHPLGPQQMRRHWLGHLTGELNLTSDEQTKIQPILEEAGNKIQTLHRGEVEQISQIMKDANARIALVLTPEQQAGLKRIESERQRDFGHMRPGDGTHDHPPDGSGSPTPPGN